MVAISKGHLNRINRKIRQVENRGHRWCGGLQGRPSNATQIQIQTNTNTNHWK